MARLSLDFLRAFPSGKTVSDDDFTICSSSVPPVGCRTTPTVQRMEVDLIASVRSGDLASGWSSSRGELRGSTGACPRPAPKAGSAVQEEAARLAAGCHRAYRAGVLGSFTPNCQHGGRATRG